METMILIVLLAHVIALLGLARFKDTAGNPDEPTPMWMEECVPVRTDRELAGRR